MPKCLGCQGNQRDQVRGCTRKLITSLSARELPCQYIAYCDAVMDKCIKIVSRRSRHA